MRRTNLPLTRARLREVLKYDPDTGWFTWLVRTSIRTAVGQRAGTRHKFGYRLIYVDSVRYREQHLAWFYMYGYWPKNQLDHINRVRDDNRWCNLRAATASQNRANSAVRSQSKLGVKGVQQMRSGRYRANVRDHGVYVCLGTYDTIEEAVAVHTARHRELHGKFSSSA